MKPRPLCTKCGKPKRRVVYVCAPCEGQRIAAKQHRYRLRVKAKAS